MATVTGDTRDGRWRRAGGYVIPGLGIVVALVAPRLVWRRLPNPMAAHWNAAGVPDGSLSRTADWLLLAGVVALVGLLPVVLTGRVRGAARLGSAIAAFGATFVVVIRIATLWANMDVADWTQARALPAAVFAGAFLIGGAAAGLGALLDRSRKPDTAAGPATSEPPRGPAVPWTGQTTTALSALLPVISVVSAVGAAMVLPPVPAIITAACLAVVAVAGALFGRATAAVSSGGLTVRMGWFGWPRLHVPIDEISEVSVEQVEPLAYGGWGLRLIPGTVAVVLRRGPGIRVRRTTGRILVVTVDGAAAGAGALAAYLSGVGHR